MLPTRNESPSRKNVTSSTVLRPGRAPACVVALGGEEELRARRLGQASGAGEEVGVDVRLGDVRDGQALLRRDREVAVDVSLGVDDDGLFGALAADEVGVLRELGVGDLSEQHGVGGFAPPEAARSV